MKIIIVALYVLLALSQTAWCATGDKVYFVSQPKFSNYSAHRQVEINSKLPAATFQNYSGTVVKLAGRAGGQTIYGGTGPGESITISGTSYATKSTTGLRLGALTVDELNNRVGVGVTTPIKTLDVFGNFKLSTIAVPLYGDNNTAVQRIVSDGLSVPFVLSVYADVPLQGSSMTQTRNRADGSPPLSGDKIGGNYFGFIRTATTSGGAMVPVSIVANASENWIDSSVSADRRIGSYLFFTTGQHGTNQILERLRISEYGNLLLGTTTQDTTSRKTLVIGSGTAPAASVADAVQLWSADIGAVAGKAGLHIRSEDGSITSIGAAVTSPQFNISALHTAPTSATDTCTLGEIRWTAAYVYLCTATNTWVRAALATW